MRKAINVQIEQIAFGCPVCSDMTIIFQTEELHNSGGRCTTKKDSLTCDECGVEIDLRDLEIFVTDGIQSQVSN